MNGPNMAERLLAWYDRVRRDLPWRENRDPYRIWVSEVMLQQTRVDAVIPYYRRFMERFPSMESLAEATEEELLAVWQGLGYYSRARRLQQGVREVVARYGGNTPETRDELKRLPGVGDYTAGAILSIAHGQPEPAVDGNVARVFSRLLHIDEPMEQTRSRRRVEAAVRNLFGDNLSCGDITQALMELGALLCLPRSPRCGHCPWTDDCQAFLRQDQQSLPVKAPSKAPVPVKVYTGILTAGEKILAVRRPDQGILAGMWEFPSAETAADDSPERGMDALAATFGRLGQSVAIGEEWRNLSHVFSHRKWNMRIFVCEGLTVVDSVPAGAMWVDRQDMDKVIWAGPHRQIADWLMLSRLD